MFANPKTLIAATVLAVATGAALLTAPATAGKSEVTEISAPPPLASASEYQTNRVAAVLPGTPAQVRAFFDANPIVDYLTPTDAIPGIVGIDYLSGDWPEVGAVRQVRLEGGSMVTERVLVNEPDQFTYQIWDITAPSGQFIDHIKGEFRYTQESEMTRVTWDYNIKPTVFVARPFIRRYLENDFGPFMKGGMEGVAGAYVAR